MTFMKINVEASIGLEALDRAPDTFRNLYSNAEGHNKNYAYLLSRGGHCIGDCTPTRDRGQSEVKRSRRNFEAGQAVKLGIRGSLRTVKVSPGD